MDMFNALSFIHVADAFIYSETVYGPDIELCFKFTSFRSQVQSREIGSFGEKSNLAFF